VALDVVVAIVWFVFAEMTRRGGTPKRRIEP